jgi:hypothetical protein
MTVSTDGQPIAAAFGRARDSLTELQLEKENCK